MKIKIYLIITSIFLLSCYDNNAADLDPEVDDSTLSDSLKTVYNTDASRMAVRYIYENDLPAKNKVIIDSTIANMYYFALVNIYNSSSDIRDTVIDTFKIHTFLNPELNNIIVAVHKDAEWTQYWKKGEKRTGISQIDNLFNLYDLEIRKYYDWPYNDTFIIRSDIPINIRALANKFESTGKVSYAEPNGWIGDGNDILGNRLEDSIKMEYHLKWGDCPAGCILDHWWTFHVDFEGTVEFIGQFGDELY